MDSLPYVIKQKQSIDARLETRFGAIGDEITRISGARLGISFNKKLRLGGGISWLKTNVTRTVDPYITDGKTSTQKYLRLGYICYYMDFVFYRSKRWTLSVPLQAGPGLAWYQPGTTYKFGVKEPKYFFLLYEPGITVNFKIFKWFGLGNDVAYRFVLKNNEKMKEHLRTPTYAFKILFWVDQLFFELLPQSDISKKYGPAQW
jgi:hypothetical protein